MAHIQIPKNGICCNERIRFLYDVFGVACGAIYTGNAAFMGIGLAGFSNDAGLLASKDERRILKGDRLMHENGEIRVHIRKCADDYESHPVGIYVFRTIYLAEKKTGDFAGEITQCLVPDGLGYKWVNCNTRLGYPKSTEDLTENHPIPFIPLIGKEMADTGSLSPYFGLKEGPAMNIMRKIYEHLGFKGREGILKSVQKLTRQVEKLKDEIAEKQKTIDILSHRPVILNPVIPDKERSLLDEALEKHYQKVRKEAGRYSLENREEKNPDKEHTDDDFSSEDAEG